MMRTVIGQDFRVKYDKRLSSSALQNASNRKFFAKSQPIFLTGCIDDTRVGTCASLPVLYVAIGRRLGYPMYLVAAKGHLMARWDEGKGTRVNLETAGGDGFVSHSDAYYRTWPQPISAREEKEQGYLKNLDSRETLAVFLSTRSAHLMANGLQEQAITAAIAANRLAPALGGIADTLRLAIHGYQDGSLEKINRLQAMLAERDHPNLYDPESPTYNRHLLPRPGYIPGQVPFPQPPPNARGTNPSLLPSSNPYSPRQQQTGLASPY